MLLAISPLGFIALEAGWMVTELGRQPWIIHGVMRTADGVTETTHLAPVFLTITALCCLGIAVVWLLSAHVIQTPTALEIAETEGVHVN